MTVCDKIFKKSKTNFRNYSFYTFQNQNRFTIQVTTQIWIFPIQTPWYMFQIVKESINSYYLISFYTWNNWQLDKVFDFLHVLCDIHVFDSSGTGLTGMTFGLPRMCVSAKWTAPSSTAFRRTTCTVCACWVSVSGGTGPWVSWSTSRWVRTRYPL